MIECYRGESSDFEKKNILARTNDSTRIRNTALRCSGPSASHLTIPLPISSHMVIYSRILPPAAVLEEAPLGL
jgi:hypothetical protein